MSAASFTARELTERGFDQLPQELQSGCHLIYSSPATLAFNSPGAEGFGVKRAGLAIPGSVMLLVAPGCCGRNTSLVARMPAYRNRFAFLTMDETDIVTGRHLRKIPQAVQEMVESLETRPSVVMICITCVDALLGTDMERVCHKAEETVGLPVRPCYMYALTREGRRPPMVHVRQSLYSLLEPRRRRSTAVNILGYFAPLRPGCELYGLLEGIGVRYLREISRCADYAAYQEMAEANVNLVLNPEARFAARDLEERLHIPYIELRRLYQVDKIHRQYAALGAALGAVLDDAAMYEETLAVIARFREAHAGLRLAIGECMNGDPFELAVAMTMMGCRVEEIYGTVTDENYVYIRRLAVIAPDVRIYSNLEPTMLHYDVSEAAVDVTIGRDAGYYRQGCPNVPWNEEEQPFGYEGLRELLDRIDRALEIGTDERGAQFEACKARDALCHDEAVEQMPEGRTVTDEMAQGGRG